VAVFDADQVAKENFFVRTLQVRQQRSTPKPDVQFGWLAAHVLPHRSGVVPHHLAWHALTAMPCPWRAVDAGRHDNDRADAPVLPQLQSAR
jgi:hypothetical protein